MKTEKRYHVVERETILHHYFVFATSKADAIREVKNMGQGEAESQDTISMTYQAEEEP